jgi:hypothetical protein
MYSADTTAYRSFEVFFKKSVKIQVHVRIVLELC